MIFNLNYGATIATLPLCTTELHSFHAHLLAECPKSTPNAADLIFGRLKNSLVQSYYSKAEASEIMAGKLSLIEIRGGTSLTEQDLVTDLHIYYYSSDPSQYLAHIRTIGQLPFIAVIDTEEIPLSNEILAQMFNTYFLYKLAKGTEMFIIDGSIVDSHVISSGTDVEGLEIVSKVETCSAQFMPDLVNNKFVASGRIALEFHVKKFLRMHYTAEELQHKYFFCASDLNRYESLEISETHITCKNVDWEIEEVKEKKKLLRAPPIERPFKSRTYGLIAFPQIYTILQRIPGLNFCELSDCHFSSLGSMFRTLAGKSRSESMTDLEATTSSSSCKKSSFASWWASQEVALWQKLRLDEIQKFSQYHSGLSSNPKIYPYLYEFYEEKKSQPVYRLCATVSDVLQKLREPLPVISPVKAPAKSCLKKRSYILNYDESMVEQAKKNAMRRVTKKDLRRRQEYITNTIKQGNEMFDVEMRFLVQSPYMERDVKVQMAEEPSYVKLIEPVDILKRSVFDKRKKEEEDVMVEDENLGEKTVVENKKEEEEMTN